MLKKAYFKKQNTFLVLPVKIEMKHRHFSRDIQWYTYVPQDIPRKVSAFHFNLNILIYKVTYLVTRHVSSLHGSKWNTDTFPFYNSPVVHVKKWKYKNWLARVFCSTSSSSKVYQVCSDMGLLINLKHCHIWLKWNIQSWRDIVCKYAKYFSYQWIPHGY